MTPERRRFLLIFGIVTLLLIGVGFLIKPKDRTAHLSESEKASDAYFAAISQELVDNGSGLPAAVVDLDRLDQNIDLVKARVRSPRALRVVEKSLPSLDLLRYVLNRAGTRRIMAFHLSRLELILKELNVGTLDILMGKPMPAKAVKAMLVRAPEADDQVSWLVDSESRLEDYVKVARDLKRRIKVSLEIDVGLRRGGFADEASFSRALELLRREQQWLEFTGLMGYDGHVPKVPFYFGLGYKDARARTLRTALSRFERFYTLAKEALPGSFHRGAGSRADQLVFNSGGSRTYPDYDKLTTVVNDLALGSAFILPENFETDNVAGHQAAVFLAAPVLKKLTTRPLPFLEYFWALLSFWNRNLEQGYVLYGGGWPNRIVGPAAVQPAWFYELNSHNLLPNQTIVTSSKQLNLKEGDYVFFRPGEGDAIVAFQNIYAFRKGKILETWHPVPMLN
jgi:D-serine deaminase-like pyridoxal phosphate-dependent protein